jgi:hypothetical protein
MNETWMELGDLVADGIARGLKDAFELKGAKFPAEFPPRVEFVVVVGFEEDGDIFFKIDQLGEEL